MKLYKIIIISITLFSFFALSAHAQSWMIDPADPTNILSVEPTVVIGDSGIYSYNHFDGGFIVNGGVVQFDEDERLLSHIYAQGDNIKLTSKYTSGIDGGYMDLYAIAINGRDKSVGIGDINARSIGSDFHARADAIGFILYPSDENSPRFEFVDNGIYIDTDVSDVSYPHSTRFEGNVVFATRNGDTVSPRIVIKEGKVGIGIDDPQSELHIREGNIKFNGDINFNDTLNMYKKLGSSYREAMVMSRNFVEAKDVTVNSHSIQIGGTYDSDNEDFYIPSYSGDVLFNTGSDLDEKSGLFFRSSVGDEKPFILPSYFHLGDTELIGLKMGILYPDSEGGEKIYMHIRQSPDLRYISQHCFGDCNSF